MLRVPFAVRPAIEFEVVIAKWYSAMRAHETPGMILLPPVSLEELALNTTVAELAKRVVGLVVVMCAVREVVVDVEIGCLEWFTASLAGEALFVPAACQTTIRCLDRFSYDLLITSSTFDLLSRRGFAP